MLSQNRTEDSLVAGGSSLHANACEQDCTPVVVPSSAHAEIRKTQDAALQITGGSAETISTDMIRAAFSTDAKLAIAPLQDYLGLGSEARVNIPGTSRNNWRWRVQETALTPDVRGQVAKLVEDSGRHREEA